MKKMIPFIDLKKQNALVENKILKALKDTFTDGDFILGSQVRMFEEEFSRYCGAKFGVGVNSGTSALSFALRAVGVGEGDEVIVPAFTFIATAFAVSYTGARPVFVDVDEETFNIDPKGIEKAVNIRTKAIIPVHLFGLPADMPSILKIARENKLKIVEDACQAHGAMIKTGGQWRKAGSLGDVGCFSFYPTKNLGGLGDGGMAVTDHEELYRKLLVLRDCGRTQSRYEHEIIGYNSRLDTLQAAALRVKFSKLDSWNALRRKAANLYDELLGKAKAVEIPKAGSSFHHVYHVYAVRSKKRDQLMRELKENNIGSGIYYPLPLHLQKAYAFLGYKAGDFPVSERLSREILCLPMYPLIKDSEIRRVVEVMEKALKRIK